MRPWIPCLLALTALSAASADDKDAELRKLFDEGMRHFRAQEYDPAKVAFERFLEQKPDADLVLALENEAGMRAFQQMLIQKGTKEIALRILRITEMRRRAVTADPAVIASLVAEVEQVREADDARNFEAYLDAKERLVRIGEPAAPALIAQLVDENHDKVRARVQITLVEMRSEAVLPLMAALADPRKLMRQNACILLGQIGDRRAVAALKARTEDAKELAEVKSAAEESLRKITGSDPTGLPPAAVCYLRLAEGWHAADPDIVSRASGADRYLWYFDGARMAVAGRLVPSYAYSDYLAEQACYEALKVDPNYAPVLPTLIGVTFSQMNEVDTLLSIATQRLVAGEGEAAEVEALKARRAALSKGKALALATGRGPLYAALRRALDRGEISVAVSCCEALKEVDDGAWLPASERAMPVTEDWGRAKYFPDTK